MHHRIGGLCDSSEYSATTRCNRSIIKQVNYGDQPRSGTQKNVDSELASGGIDTEGVETPTDNKCVTHVLKRLIMLLALLTNMRKHSINALLILILVYAIAPGPRLILNECKDLDDTYGIVYQYEAKKYNSSVLPMTAISTALDCTLARASMLFTRKTVRESPFDPHYDTNELTDEVSVCCDRYVIGQIDQHHQPQCVAQEKADTIIVSVDVVTRGVQAPTDHECVQYALEKLVMLAHVVPILPGPGISPLPVLALVDTTTIGSKAILIYCQNQSNAAYRTVAKRSNQTLERTTLPYTVIVVATAKLILFEKKLRRFPLGQPVLYIKPDGCEILVHRAAAATAPSGALIRARVSDLYSYSEVLRPAVLKDKYKSCDFGKDTEFYACNVGPQAYPQATTIIGEDAQGCILACEKDVHTSFICVLGEERRREKRKTRKTSSRKSETHPQTGLKLESKIKGGISNKSHGLDDVTLDLTKQPKDPPFDLVIKYANFESKAA